MSGATQYEGPLHLQRHLMDISDELGQAIRHAVHHPVSIVRSICCACRHSDVLKALAQPEGKKSSVRLNTLQIKKLAEKQREARESGRFPAEGERRQNCRIFSLEVNEEAGLVYAYCKRCQKKFLVFDQALYWGIPRKEEAETFPYRCGCGGHTFEVGMGFEYYADPMDENDLAFVTIAVRCMACDEIAVVFDEEGS